MYDRTWERLLDYLNEWATAREVPRGVEVTFEQSPGLRRTVEIVMTPADWKHYLGIVNGSDDPATSAIQGRLMEVPDLRSDLRQMSYAPRTP